jgi:folate-binding Fe-S cluster repair protein YgfZ
VPTHQPLTNPLDALLLGRVRRWVEVVFRQRTKCGQLDPDGRPWTRCPAKDLARQLEEQEGLVVSERRIQRSLARLEEEGHFARQQRGIWRRDFWYSFSDSEWQLQQHRPTAVQSKATLASEPSDGTQASPATVQNLSITSNNQNLSRAERKVASRLDHGGAVSTARGAYKGQQLISRARGRGNALDTLQRVVQRAAARGFVSHQKPEAPPQAESWVDGSYRYTRLASGHVVKDLLATAPLR